MPSTINPIPGLHHVTAITADAQKNLDFYCGLLGLRLAKRTVNFDDPGSYHLYYGDELGRPGTILTFFVWSGAYPGRIGPPRVSATAFAVPIEAVDFWAKRLKDRAVETQSVANRFGQPVLAFSDPDGMRVELIGVADPNAKGHAIYRLHGVTLSLTHHEKTASFLTEVMGFKSIGSEANRIRFRADSPDGSIVDLLSVPKTPQSLGAGIVHHVAFRAPDDAEQKSWQEHMAALGMNVSPVMDRVYFHSIYFHEPGGVLFEIATDHPGFSADEPADQLGQKIMLPPWLENRRAAIERALPPLRLPSGLDGRV